MEWRKLNDHIGVELEINSSLERINRMVISSYNGLPFRLKACFLYLSIFPEGHNLRRRRLVRRWIAEGYSSEMLSMAAEEIGEKHFTDLLNRSMIQPSKATTSNCDKVSFCRVNNLMRAISISKTAEEKLVCTLDDSSTNLNSRDKVWHLVLSSKCSRDKNNALVRCSTDPEIIPQNIERRDLGFRLFPDQDDSIPLNQVDPPGTETVVSAGSQNNQNGMNDTEVNCENIELNNETATSAERTIVNKELTVDNQTASEAGGHEEEVDSALNITEPVAPVNQDITDLVAPRADSSLGTGTEESLAPPGFPLPIYKDAPSQNLFVGAMQFGNDVADPVFQKMMDPCNSESFIGEEGTNLWKDHFAPASDSDKVVQAPYCKEGAHLEELESTPKEATECSMMTSSTSALHAKRKRKDKAPLVETEGKKKKVQKRTTAAVGELEMQDQEEEAQEEQ